MKSYILAALAAVFAAAPAYAIQNVPVPTSNYIVFGGNDWAWASPCSPGGCWAGAEIDMSYQSTQGWRIATTADLATGPQQSDFLRPDGSLICASNWFTMFNHCDYGDPVWNQGQPGGVSWAETWTVRDGVPEPAGWAMMILGFGLVGVATRSRRNIVAA